MNVGLIISGLVFLFMPNFNIIDILPDFIGCALIMKGISKVQLVNLSLTESYEAFRRLLIVGLCKIPAMGIYGLINVQSAIVFGPDGVIDQNRATTDYTSLLLVCILFATLEIIFSLKAFSALFEGIRASALEKTEYAANVNYNYIRWLTLAYVTVKPIMYTAPELSSLSTGNYGVVTNKGVVALVEYRNVFNIISFVICLGLGIFWLVKSVSYFKGIKNDTEYLTRLDEKAIGAIENKKEAARARKLLFALSLFVAAVFFTLEMRIDGLDVIPSFIAGGLFIAFLFLLPDQKERSEKIAKIVSIFYTLVSAGFWVYSLYMSSLFKSDGLMGYGDILRFEMEDSFEVMDMYIIQSVLSFAGTLLFAILTIILYKRLKLEKEKYSSVPELSESVLRMDVEDAIKLSKTLDLLLRIWTVLGIVCALSSTAHTLLIPYFPHYWMIDAAVRVVYLVVSVAFVSYLRPEIAKADKRSVYFEAV